MRRHRLNPRSRRESGARRHPSAAWTRRYPVWTAGAYDPGGLSHSPVKGASRILACLMYYVAAATIRQAMTDLEHRALDRLPAGVADGLRAALQALTEVSS
jgi:hypothetical protein